MKKSFILLVLLFVLIGTGCANSDLTKALNSDAYNNCEVLTEASYDGSAFGYTKSTSKMTIYIDGDNIKIPVNNNGITGIIYCYKENNKYYFYENNSYSQIKSEIKLDQFEEYSDILGEYDSDDFEKEEDYFVLKANKTDEYVDSLLGEILEDKETLDNLSFQIKIKIENKLVKEILTTATFLINGNANSVSYKMTVSNIGNVEVSIPQDVKDEPVSK